MYGNLREETRMLNSEKLLASSSVKAKQNACRRLSTPFASLISKFTPVNLPSIM